MIGQQQWKKKILIGCVFGDSLLDKRRRRQSLLIVVGILLLKMMILVKANTMNELLNPRGEGDRETLILHPGREIISESLKPASFDSSKYNEQELRIYKLINMKPFTQYELRISYPAYTPAVFSIEILSEMQLENRVQMIKSPRHSRKLLNIEKVMFKLDQEGEDDVALLTRFALVSAQVEAPSTFDNSNSLLYYNIGKFLRRNSLMSIDA